MSARGSFQLHSCALAAESYQGILRQATVGLQASSEARLMPWAMRPLGDLPPQKRAAPRTSSLTSRPTRPIMAARPLRISAAAVQK